MKTYQLILIALGLSFLVTSCGEGCGCSSDQTSNETSYLVVIHYCDSTPSDTLELDYERPIDDSFIKKDSSFVVIRRYGTPQEYSHTYKNVCHLKPIAKRGNPNKLKAEPKQ